MLTTTNRGGIRASVKQWSQRKSIPDEVLNDFIEIALSTATRALRIPPLEFFQSLPISANGYVELPYDFQEAKEVYLVINGKNVLLERKSINEVDWNMNASTGVSTPYFFGRFGNYLRIAPWNGSEDALLNLYYYKIIPPMPDDQATNWFTKYAPEVLLYGAMQELCNYTRDLDGMQIWKSKFDESIGIIQAVEDRAAWNGSTIGISLKGSTPR
jgi:hypothetical protein